jgi:hypothetical protein
MDRCREAEAESLLLPGVDPGGFIAKIFHPRSGLWRAIRGKHPQSFQERFAR